MVEEEEGQVVKHLIRESEPAMPKEYLVPWPRQSPYVVSEAIGLPFRLERRCSMVNNSCC